MNLLVISREFPPYIIGGISHHLYNLYTNMASKGHKITVLAGKSGEAKQEGFETTSDRITTSWIEVKSLNLHHIKFPVLVAKQIQEMNIDRFDAILTHTEIPFPIDKPIIAKYHDSKQQDRKVTNENRGIGYSIADNVINPTRRLVDRLSIRYSDHQIFNSKLTYDLWDKYYGVPGEENVIYNGVDRDVFYPRNVERDQYVLFVGGGERKGISKVEDFATRVDYTVRVVGGNQLSGENIKSTGRVNQEELAKLYSGAIATIHPARFEAFGNVILESLSCGTPVVISDQCGAAEIIDQSCGVVTTDIKSGLEKVEGSDIDDCVRIAKNYTWEKVSEQTESLVRDVIEN